MNAAGEGFPADKEVSMTDHGVVNTAKPELLDPPLAKELEVVYICFDMLFMGEHSIINLPLQVRVCCFQQQGPVR
jgi:ATP-dependent DNA ligase